MDELKSQFNCHSMENFFWLQINKSKIIVARKQGTEAEVGR